MFIDDENEREGHRATQSAVRHDELLNASQFVKSKAISNRGKQDHA